MPVPKERAQLLWNNFEDLSKRAYEYQQTSLMKGSGWDKKAQCNYQEIVGDKEYCSVIRKLLHGGGGTIASRRNKVGEAALFFPLGKPIPAQNHVTSISYTRLHYTYTKLEEANAK